MSARGIRRVTRVVPGVYGRLLAGYAVVALAFSAVPRLQDPLLRLRVLLDVVLLPLPETSVAWAAALLLLAGGVLARKRVAWAVAVALTGAVAAVNLLVLAGMARAGAPEVVWYRLAAVLQAAILVLLLAAHREFPARVRPGAFGRAAAAYLAVAAIGVAAGRALVGLFPGPPGAALPAQDRLPWVLDKVVGLALVPHEAFAGRPPAWLAALLGVIGAAAILAATIALLRSQAGRNALTARDEIAIRALLHRWGDRDSLGYFATRRDRSVAYAPSGLAAVSYRVELGVALAAGDPVGDPAHWDAAIGAFLAEAARYGWAPAVVGASAEGARAWRGRGMAELHLGDEAVLDCADLHLRGPERRTLRQAVRRARRAGVAVRIRRQAEIPAGELAAIAADAGAWRGDAAERGFSMALGRVGDPADGAAIVVEARHAGRRVAVLGFSPWGRTGASLDLMRRAPAAPGGTVELMVTTLCREGADLGIRRISLNFAVARAVFASEGRLGVGPLLRAWRGVLVFASRFWQLESLYRSNARYGPRWVPRYLCFASPRTLPRVAAATAMAEGFLPRGRAARGFSGAADDSPGALAAYAAAPGLLAGEPAPAPRRVPADVAARMAAAARIRDAGGDPWPVGMPPGAGCAELAGAAPGARLTLAGRVLARRDHGGVVFLELRDFTGGAQVIVERRRPAAHAAVAGIARGDLVQVTGVRGDSRTGRASLLADELRLTAKCLRPPQRGPAPRRAGRVVALALRDRPRELLRARAATLRALREELHARGYLEAETPILQRVHGGAAARPFRTRMNALDLELSLRIAPELALKRLLAGGVDRVYELGRVFRNEGADATHNPEFTALEAYCAHGDQAVMRELAEALIRAAAVAVRGSATVPAPDGGALDVSGPWPVRDVHAAVTAAVRAAGVAAPELTPATDAATLRRILARLGLPARPDADAGSLVLALYEELVEPATVEPTFYLGFPESVCPLTRADRARPGVAERWDLVAFGMELGTAYTELTDPLEQRARLEAQSLLAAGGDPEAMEVDEEFLAALEFGMPPAGGLGLGVDRLVMLLTGADMREAVTFPMTRGGSARGASVGG